jgi:hypothetical protein
MHMQTLNNGGTDTGAAGPRPVAPLGDLLAMPRNRLKEQRAYIEAACLALKTDYSGLARKARLSTTTITRPMNQADWSFEFSERSLNKVAQAAGLPPFDLWVQGNPVSRGSGAAAPTLLIAADAQGRTLITLPAESAIADEAPTVLRLYAAMPAARRQLFLMALKHPDLTPGGIGSTVPAPPSEDLLYELAESSVDSLIATRGVTLTKLERNKLIQQIVEDVETERAGRTGAAGNAPAGKGSAGKGSAGKGTVQPRKSGKAARAGGR